MKKKTSHLFILAYFLFNGLLYAEDVPQPPLMARPGGGGNDTGTPGAVSSPIDMYVYILAIAAILMIAYFAKKYKTQKI
ncbi:signal peptidase [Chryseobacterium wangxinyae]|uniref:signal peptidase n=1 Tax=Chryseobacterium sp. CY353 TaxID=2997334 RepID=UPI0022719BF4|nr:signal peptidase [Chryseobacterium sp. CY353]MCY0970920.1 signal peptidase [Chryseobacterium sp. CY353]